MTAKSLKPQAVGDVSCGGRRRDFCRIRKALSLQVADAPKHPAGGVRPPGVHTLSLLLAALLAPGSSPAKCTFAFEAARRDRHPARTRSPDRCCPGCRLRAGHQQVQLIEGATRKRRCPDRFAALGDLATFAANDIAWSDNKSTDVMANVVVTTAHPTTASSRFPWNSRPSRVAGTVPRQTAGNAAAT